MNIQILIADVHEVVRVGVRSFVAGTEIEVVAEAKTGEEAVRKTQEHRPDVVVLEVRMVNCDGLTALERIKQRLPGIPVMMLSAYDNPTYVARAVALGASGYLLKTTSRDQLLDAVRKVASGENVWSRSDLRRVSGALESSRLGENVDVPLTKRETEVLRQMALGLTNKQIAKLLFISAETVKEHVQHILRKVGVSHRTQAAVWAVRKGMV